MRIASLAFVALLFLSSEVFAQRVFHVSSNGNGVTCSSQAPCDFASFVDQAEPGDEALLESGQYGSIVLEDQFNGTPNARIKIKARQTHRAIFSRLEVQGTYISLEGMKIDAKLINRNAKSYQVACLLTGQHIELSNMEILGPGRHTIFTNSLMVRGSYNSVKSSKVSDSHHPFESSGRGHQFLNNEIFAGGGSTLRISGSEHLIEGNLIHDSRKTVAQDRWCAGTGPMVEWRYTCESGVRAGQSTPYTNNGPHRNLFSARAISNVMIRGNRLWDSDIPSLRIRNSTGGSPSGENIVIENNIIPQFFGYTGEYFVRNNVMGSVSFGNSTEDGLCKVHEFSLNIASTVSYRNSGDSPCQDVVYRDYNIIVPFCRSGFSCGSGPNTVKISNVNKMREVMSEMFVNYTGFNGTSDFRLNPDFEIAPGISAIDFGPVDRAATNDVLGRSRFDYPGKGNDANHLIADLGIYEHISGGQGGEDLIPPHAPNNLRVQR